MVSNSYCLTRDWGNVESKFREYWISSLRFLPQRGGRGTTGEAESRTASRQPLPKLRLSYRNQSYRTSQISARGRTTRSRISLPFRGVKRGTFGPFLANSLLPLRYESLIMSARYQRSARIGLATLIAITLPVAIICMGLQSASILPTPGSFDGESAVRVLRETFAIADSKRA